MFFECSFCYISILPCSVDESVSICVLQIVGFLFLPVATQNNQRARILQSCGFWSHLIIGEASAESRFSRTDVVHNQFRTFDSHRVRTHRNDWSFLYRKAFCPNFRHFFKQFFSLPYFPVFFSKYWKVNELDIFASSGEFHEKWPNASVGEHPEQPL